MAVGELKSNVHPQRAVSFSNSYTSDAVRRTGMVKRRQVQALRSSQLELTPQKIGSYAARVRMSDQENKTTHDRFLDLFA